MYRHLDTEDSTTTTQNEQRKAQKKLREIAQLEQKENLTTEEAEKVKMKQKWANILDSNLMNGGQNKQPDDECKMKQQARHMLKEQKRQREKEKQQKEAERKQQEAVRRQEEKDKWVKLQAEKLEQEAREAKEQFEKFMREQWESAREEAKKEQQSREQRKKEDAFTNSLKNEFAELLRKQGGNVNRVFRLLSRKYHPDKNNNTDTSAENQKHLSNIRDKFLSGEYKYKYKYQ
jgi:hypothetical protein